MFGTGDTDLISVNAGYMDLVKVRYWTTWTYLLHNIKHSAPQQVMPSTTATHVCILNAKYACSTFVIVVLNEARLPLTCAVIRWTFLEGTHSVDSNSFLMQTCHLPFFCQKCLIQKQQKCVSTTDEQLRWPFQSSCCLVLFPFLLSSWIFFLASPWWMALSWEVALGALVNAS